MCNMVTENEFNMQVIRSKALINSFCYKYRGFNRDDINQCCLIGIFNAMKSYDERLNSSFDAFATKYVKTEINDFVAKSMPISRSRETQRKISKVKSFIENTGCFDPSDEELIDMKLTRREFDTYKYSYSFVSLDTDIDSDDSDSDTYHSMVPDNSPKSIRIVPFIEGLANKKLISKEEVCLLKEIYIEQVTEAELAMDSNKSRQSINKQKQKALIKLREIVKREFDSYNEAVLILTR